MNNDEVKAFDEISNDLGFENPVNLLKNIVHPSSGIGNLIANKFIIDIEFTNNIIPERDFNFNEENGLVWVRCYFCKKEREIPLTIYQTSLWGYVTFKNEVDVIACSPFCFSLDKRVQNLLKPFDITRYNSPHVSSENVYLGKYKFLKQPEHNFKVVESTSIFRKCFFCEREVIQSVREEIYSSWGNLEFPTGEVISICSQECIPPEFEK